MKLLNALGMSGGYGGVDIVMGCSIEVDRGEISAIVGPNGAGKSTAMKAILGLVKLRQGEVLLDGENITSLSPELRVSRGIAFVPQTENVFPSLTVEENLEMGAYLRRTGVDESKEQVYALFPILKDKRRQDAGELSGGQRQQLAVARALMTEPTLLMLDEPTAGVAPIVVNELFDQILHIKETGIGIIMVEQNARQALEIADFGYVMVNGENRYTDTGKSLLADAEVRRTFIGG
tara:strand:+ start:1295 stop:1999 length:705 start_codon:yes stop_codon:yes gene_type:complete